MEATGEEKDDRGEGAHKNSNQPMIVTREDATGDGGVSEGGQGRSGRGRGW
jgi:hypothetical protein